MSVRGGSIVALVHWVFSADAINKGRYRSTCTWRIGTPRTMETFPPTGSLFFCEETY